MVCAVCSLPIIIRNIKIGTTHKWLLLFFNYYSISVSFHNHLQCFYAFALGSGSGFFRSDTDAPLFLSYQYFFIIVGRIRLILTPFRSPALTYKKRAPDTIKQTPTLYHCQRLVFGNKFVYFFLKSLLLHLLPAIMHKVKSTCNLGKPQPQKKFFQWSDH